MKNRLLKQVASAKKHRKKLFCAFLTFGYPTPAATMQLIEEFEKAGVDIVELGFPFSDPLADGPTIQYSSERALKRGVHINGAFELVASLRKKGSKIPILFFSYLNPILHYGFKPFAEGARRAGFDGLIVPDLPPGEETGLEKECRKNGLAQVFLVAPTTESKRAAWIAKQSQGFVYYVSLRGVTGARRSLPSDVERHIQLLRRKTKKSFLVGFGVSTPSQARALSEISQGVIVGSALIDRLRQSRGKLKPAVRFIKNMVRAVKGNHVRSPRA